MSNLCWRANEVKRNVLIINIGKYYTMRRKIILSLIFDLIMDGVVSAWRVLTEFDVVIQTGSDCPYKALRKAPRAGPSLTENGMD